MKRLRNNRTRISNRNLRNILLISGSSLLAVTSAQAAPGSWLGDAAGD